MPDKQIVGSDLVAIDELDPSAYPRPAESDFAKLADIALTRDDGGRIG